MGEEKEDKPKKMFTFTVTVWDDGEVESEMYEFRDSPTGRGRPGKWRLNSNDFVKRVEEILGDYDRLSEEWNKSLGKGAKLLLGMQMIGNSPTAVTEVKTQESQKKSKTKKDEIDEKEDPEPDINDMDFGGFNDDDNKKK